MARNTITVVMGLLLIAALVFIFVELPGHCDDSDSTFHSHCHHLRDAGVNCRPGQNCWDDSLGDNTPGEVGWVIIGFVVILLAVALTNGCDDPPRYAASYYAPHYYPPPPGPYRESRKSVYPPA